MNPLFLSHLVADFLLQTRKLVAWKEKTLDGIVIHSAIHGIVITLLLQSFNKKAAIVVAIIALLHGIIDYGKVHYNKAKSFEYGFLIDQAAHLLVMFIAARYIALPKFWYSQNGIALGLLLYFASYFIAVHNLLELKKYPIKTLKDHDKRFGAITLVFVAYFLAAIFVA